MEKHVLAIDPGCEQSAYCVMITDNFRPLRFGKFENAQVLKEIALLSAFGAVAIEMVASYGMPVGREVFETCVWIGRFTQAVVGASGKAPDLIYRSEEKLNICNSPRATDATIRRALIDRFARHDLKNGKGTKKNPDWFYGFSADVWAAYAVGVTWIDKQIYGT